MHKLSVIALDDEIPALEVVETFASRSTSVDLKGTFTKTGAALKYLARNPVDLIFLDIRMPAMKGTDFAKLLDPEMMVIFTTSYAEYAAESYELDAIDYLLKPFSYQRFLKSLQKAQEWYQAKHGVHDAAPLILKANYGKIKVWPNEILFIQGLDNYAKIYLAGKKTLTVRITLKELMEILPKHRFLRVHRSYIVSLDRIQFVRNRMIYVDNQEIPLGTTYVSAFQQYFNPKD